MLSLHAPTHPAWLDRVLPHLDELLLDHAHCEKKAAGHAVKLLFDLAPLLPDAAVPLSELAREELEHFERVLDLLRRRGVPFGRQVPAPYGRRLKEAVRGGRERLLDELLCAALIEARSCERMKLLGDAVPEPEVAAMYRDLLASEARHHALFVDLAERLRPDVDVRARLRELAQHEAAILAAPPSLARMHA